MKEYIKTLAREQQELKKARKTGTLEESYTWYNGSSWPEHVAKARRAAITVQRNKILITAALNLYHELRGSDHRHNVSDEDYYCYKGDLRTLRERFAVESPPVA